MSLSDVDWATIPAPSDDGAAAHLAGMKLPDVTLPATSGDDVNLAALSGLSVLYIYPMTGRPDRDLPDGWNDTPGARGCTPQSCAFRDHLTRLRALGVTDLFGISTQSTAWQQEAAERLHLPYSLLSDESAALTKALNLPTFTVDGDILLKRLTLIARDGEIIDVAYPVFPPDQDAARVVDWLEGLA